MLSDTLFFATRLFVPASLVAFATGLTMAYLGTLFSELWIWIGMAGFATTFLTGAVVIKQRSEKLLAAIKSGGSSFDVSDPGRELLRIVKFDYVMLFTVAANMVLKPKPADSAVLVVMAVVVFGAGVLFLGPLFRSASPRAVGG